MIDQKTAPYAALILRVTLGALLIAHGVYLKAILFGMAGVAGYFQSLGLPGWFAWPVMLYETIGGAMLILGIFTRPAAAFLGVHLLAAAWFGHSGNGWLFQSQGGGWEYPLMWSMALFSLALIGDGAMALKPWSPKSSEA